MKRLINIVLLLLFLIMSHAQGAGNNSQDREKEYEKLRGPVSTDDEREKFVAIDTKKVRFPHKKHQSLIKEIGLTCKVCHHKRKKGKKPRACKRCHERRRTISTGKYVQAGKKLNQREVFHLLCGDCHKKMFIDNFRRKDGSPAEIPVKCHHCHLIKDR